jgi:hypothetical protein
MSTERQARINEIIALRREKEQLQKVTAQIAQFESGEFLGFVSDDELGVDSDRMLRPVIRDGTVPTINAELPERETDTWMMEGLQKFATEGKFYLGMTPNHRPLWAELKIITTPVWLIQLWHALDWQLLLLLSHDRKRMFAIDDNEDFRLTFIGSADNPGNFS